MEPSLIPPVVLDALALIHGLEEVARLVELMLLIVEVVVLLILDLALVFAALLGLWEPELHQDAILATGIATEEELPKVLVITALALPQLNGLESTAKPASETKAFVLEEPLITPIADALAQEAPVVKIALFAHGLAIQEVP